MTYPITIAFQLNPLYGYGYLDKCGAFLADLEENHPEWFPRDFPKPSGAAVDAIEYGYSVNIDCEKFHFVRSPWLKKYDFDHFCDQLQIVFCLAKQHFGYKFYERVGCRIQQLYPQNSIKDAQDLSKKLFDPPTVFPSLLEGFDLAEWQPKLIFNYGSQRVTISIYPCYRSSDRSHIDHPSPYASERQRSRSNAQLCRKNEDENEVKDGLMIDMDFLDHRPDSELDPVEFVKRNFEESMKFCAYIDGEL